MADAYARLVLSMKPFAYYRMERPKDEKNNTTVFDSAPSGHHGKLHLANEDAGDSWWNRRFGIALNFRGSDALDYIDVPNFPASDTNQLSVTAWVYALSRGWWGKIASECDWRSVVHSQFHFGLYDSTAT